MSGTVSDDLWLDTFNALWFPLWSVFKRHTEDKKYTGPMLCYTAFQFHNHRPREALDKLTMSIFAIRIHLWRVSSKYPANISGPLNPLNKHNEKPATNIQTIWNETSLCVLSSGFILGCFCVWWITNNKLQNICSVWMIVEIFFLNIFRLQANWILCRFLAKHM